MKTYTISATCDLMPVAYISVDDFDYFFTTNRINASTFTESEVDHEIELYASYHPEYNFSKTEVDTK